MSHLLRFPEHDPSRFNMAFSGLVSFLRSPVVSDLTRLDADFAVLGVPFDEGMPFYPGARMGPRSIREHSMRFGETGGGVYNPLTGETLLERERAQDRIVDVGDADVLTTHVVGTFAGVTEKVRAIRERGARVVVIGGDHAITYPVVCGLAGEEVHVLHFDAHLDYIPFTHGVSLSNGNPFRQVNALQHVASLTQLGIRSLRDVRATFDDAEGDGSHIITTADYRSRSFDEIFAHIPQGAKVYVSMDIDVLDMSLVPGCVSAEPNGLMYDELLSGLRQIASDFDVVGFDVVEVNPLLDVRTGVTSYLAAHLMVEFIGLIGLLAATEER